MKERLQKYSGILLVLIAASSYGILSPVIKLAYQHGWSELQVISVQLISGTGLLWLCVLCMPRMWMNPFREPWIRLGLVGVFGLSLTSVLLNSSLMLLKASIALVILFQFTWITILMESVLLRRWPNRIQWFSVAIILIGTSLAVGLSFDDLKQIDVKGMWLAFGSAITYSIFLTFTSRIKTRLPAVTKSAVMTTLALPFALVLLNIMHPQQHFFQENMEPLWLWGLLLGMLGAVIPIVFFNVGIPKIGSSLAAVLGSVELPVAIVGALVLLHEQVTWTQWIGIAMIVGGMMITEKKS